MKIFVFASAVFLLQTVASFHVPGRTIAPKCQPCFSGTTLHPSKLYSSSSSDSKKDDNERTKRMQDILAEEAQNPQNMARSAEVLKNLRPEDLDQMLKEVENMSPAQLEQLKGMGMNPDVMKQSMKMMKNNPAMIESMQEIISNMSPEQLVKESRIAQERMANMSPEEIARVTTAAASVVQSAESVSNMAATSRDPAVIDSMFRVAEYMSQPPTGGVTFQAFATLPPISVLSGASEEDLSKQELTECWSSGSLGATRVDRQGFERVWNEVQDYFEDDIMGEARKTAAKKSSKRGGSTSDKVLTRATQSAPSIGQSLTPDQVKMMNERAKNLSDEEMDMMLDEMSNLSPEAAARMKTMGVDPAMMQKASSMMKNNPMMRKAAQAMMKNMSPEQMMKASQQAQERMKNMSSEDIKKAMDEMESGKN